MFSNVVLDVRSVSKTYELFTSPIFRILHLLGVDVSPAPTFTALKDVSFELLKGETLGVVGRNGSGKSTLLQIIAGIVKPSSGVVTVNGRIGALLELGAGFNPEFTGRENVRLNGLLLGLSKQEIDARMEQIVEFAEIGPFIDQPVRAYSSGMILRLAFSVQAQINPDLLIVDEALAVGDSRFQVKCFERLRQLKQDGTSILFVSHVPEQIVSHCDRALLLDHGVVLDLGNPRQIMNQYQDLLFGVTSKFSNPGAQSSSNMNDEQLPCLDGEEEVGSVSWWEASEQFDKRPGYNPSEYRWGDYRARITDFRIQTDEESYPSKILSGERVAISISVEAQDEIINPIFGITIKTPEGITIYGSNTEYVGGEEVRGNITSGQTITVVFSFVCRLAEGEYFVSLGVASAQGHQVAPHDRRYDAIQLNVASNRTILGLCDLDLEISTDLGSGPLQR